MARTWTQRREALLSDCIVSPDVFTPMIDRLAAFVVPYQQALETEAAQRNMHLYLQGLLSHLPSKNAEDMATFVDIERQVIQAFIGTAPWDHRPLLEVLVPQVVHRLGQPDGIIAFDPSSFPKRGIHSVGVKRQWCGHRGKVDNCQGGVFMGYVADEEHALLDFRLFLPQEWARDAQRRQACHVPPEVRYQTRQEQCLEMLDAWRALCAGRALHHHDACPRRAATRVSRPWSSSKATLAIGDGVAPGARSERLEAIDGPRRCEGSGSHRDGPGSGADADGAPTPRTRRVAGDHPSSSDGRVPIGGSCLSRCHRSRRPLPLSV